MSFFSKLQQNVQVSDGNSSTSNLDGYGTFTGTIQDTLGVAGIQVNLSCDQNCRVYIDQSMDNTPNWDITDEMQYHSSYDGDSWTIQATASYVRIRVQNQSATATTWFRLQTALCPIVEAIPRSLSENGYFKVAIEEIIGKYDTDVTVSPMGALKTTEATRLIGTSFGSTFDPNFWTKATRTGTSDAIVANRILTLSTNPTGIESGNSIIVTSNRTARYIPGSPNCYRGVIRLPAITGANIRRWGPFNPNTGYFFEHDGTTLKVGQRKSAVDTVTSSGSFNGHIGNIFIDDTFVHTYEICWTNRSVWYFIDGDLLHHSDATEETFTSTNNLQISQECSNGANTNNNTLEVWVCSINRLGKPLHTPQSLRISTLTTTVLKYSAGNLHSIVFGTRPTAAGTITIYDNTVATGTVLWAGTVRQPVTEQTPMSIDFRGLPFSNGLTIVTATNASDFTVIYE